MEEVLQFQARLAELSKRNLLDEGVKLLSPEAGQAVVAELDFLLALIELRRGIDVQRSLLLERGELRPYVPFRLDAELRRAFEQILQGVPLSVGATPDRGTEDYARSGHFARGVVVEQYAAIHSIPPRLRARHIPASSAMALLADVLLSAASERASDGRRPVIGWVGRTYLETRQVLEKVLGSLPFPARRQPNIVCESFEDPRKTGLDVLVLEPIENHPDGVARRWGLLEGFVRRQRARILIVDVTLDPLVLSDLATWVPRQTVCVAVESLTKYAQAGSNVASGGIATIIPGQSPQARRRATAIADGLCEMTRLLGQHMDPRLAITLVPSQDVLRERLRRMRRNARLVAKVFKQIAPDRVRHACDAQSASTLVYLNCSINWRAVDVDTLRRFRRWHKGEKRTKAFVRQVESEFLRPRGEGDKDAAILRVSTSFGFNATSAHAVVRDRSEDDFFWVRVAAGMESVEHLDYLLEFRLGGWLPCLTEKWEKYYSAWPNLIRSDDATGAD